MNLRQKITRLAYAKPHLRGHLLPLLVKIARPIPLDLSSIAYVAEAVLEEVTTVLAWAAKGNQLLEERVLTEHPFFVEDVKGVRKHIRIVVRTSLKGGSSVFQGAGYHDEALEDPVFGPSTPKGVLTINLKGGIFASELLESLVGTQRATALKKIKGYLVHELTHARDILKTKGYLSPDDIVVKTLIMSGGNAKEVQTLYLDKSPKQRDVIRNVIHRLLDTLQENVTYFMSLPKEERFAQVLQRTPEGKSMPKDLREFLVRHPLPALQGKGYVPQMQKSDRQDLDTVLKGLSRRYVNQQAEVKARLQEFMVQARDIYEMRRETVMGYPEFKRIPYLLASIPIWDDLEPLLDAPSKKYFLKALYQEFAVDVTADRSAKWFEIARRELSTREGVEVKLMGEVKGNRGVSYYNMQSAKGKSGSREWVVFRSEADAEKHVLFDVQERLHEEPRTFDMRWLRNVLEVDEPTAQEMAAKSAEAYVKGRTDADLLVEAHLKGKWEDLQESGGKDFRKQQQRVVVEAREYLQGMRKAYIFNKLQNDPLGYAEDYLGLAKGVLPKWVSIADNAAQDAIDNFGVAHLLDMKTEVDLRSGALACGV